MDNFFSREDLGGINEEEFRKDLQLSNKVNELKKECMATTGGYAFTKADEFLFKKLAEYTLRIEQLEANNITFK